MTSLFGMRSNSGEEGIVVSADTQLSIYDGPGKELIEKRQFHKIWYGKSWVLAHAGGLSHELYRFQGLMKGQKRYDSSEEKVEQLILKAVNSFYFEEVNMLNRTVRKQGTELDFLNSFLLATMKPSLGLWEVDEFGNLLSSIDVAKIEEKERDFEYLLLGSGEERMKQYIGMRLEDDKNLFDPQSISLDEAIRFSNELIDKAERDPGTSTPIDFVVLTKNGVNAYGKRLFDVVQQARLREIDKIANTYKKVEIVN